MRKAAIGNKWGKTITLDDATVERLDWMQKNCGFDSVSAAVRFAIAEQYRRSNTDQRTARK